ncbi:MAG TPA: hypothetical protein VH678_25670 [Xanthobacteraceae bacterium]|jgi:hypothetical protein
MMRSLRSWWAYCAIFVLFAVAAVVTTGVWQVTAQNLQCRSSGYDNEHFLAYCDNPTYADYEHGALLYGIEPGVIDNLRGADVLFVGNSKAQFAFSSKAVEDYFDSIHVRFFVLGFGYGEESTFALAVLRKWPVSPKLLVINADPFFSTAISSAGSSALEGKPAFFWRLALKLLFQRVHRGVCFVASHVCPESKASIFRSARNGQWRLSSWHVAEKSVAVDGSGQITMNRESLRDPARLGEEFLNAVGVSRNCVILTGVPNSLLDSPGIAAGLASFLKTQSVLPAVGGLATIDSVHLNPASVERWSAQFVQAMTPILRKCLPSRAF